MIISIGQTSPNGENVNSGHIKMPSTELKYQCRQRPGLKFNNLEGCQARRTRAEEYPKRIDLLGCKECPGPLPLKETGDKKVSSNENDDSRTKISSEETETCKCGRGPVVIRKNGVSAGRCRQCMSDTAKSWPRGKQKKTMPNQSKELDAYSLVTLLKERKEEAENIINTLIENGAVNGDKDISQAIVSFVKLTATIDVLLKAELSVNVEKKTDLC